MVLTSQFNSILEELSTERSVVVLALVHMCIQLGMNAGTYKDNSANHNWKNMVMIDLPAGQVSWHIHKNDWHLFEELQKYDGRWDGHDKAEREYRIKQLTKK